MTLSFFKYMAVIILASKVSCLQDEPTLPTLLKLYFHNVNETCTFSDCSNATMFKQCVKATSRAENTTIYLTALNQCQVDYVKCHEDLSVNIVSKRFCSSTRPLNNTMASKEHGSQPLNASDNALRTWFMRGRPRTKITLPKYYNNTELQNMDTESEPEEACPSSCPATVRMVCGRCQHGVYKSFMSVCHLRMYQCNHEEEKPMQLVSRGPCPYSAPYLSDPGMAPRAIASSAHDDVVSRFITCREKHHVHRNNYTIPQSFKDDPDCQFDGLYSIDKMFSFCLIGCCSKCFNRG